MIKIIKYITITILLFIFLQNCTNVKSKTLKSRSIQEYHDNKCLNDTLFKHIGIKKITDNDIEVNESGNELMLRKLNKNQKVMLTDNIPLLSDYLESYTAFFYCKYPNVNNLCPIAIYIISYNIEGLVLVLLKDGLFYDYLPITKNWGELIDEDDQKEIVYSEKKWGEFINDSVFHTIELQKKEIVYLKSNKKEVYIDSLTLLYNITKEGFELENKDSIHYKIIP